MPAISLDPEARILLESYPWRGNIRQLKNVAEQISAIEEARLITAEILRRYLPSQTGEAPMRPAASRSGSDEGFSTERELLYKILFDMRADINDLKRMMQEAMRGGSAQPAHTASQEPMRLLPPSPASSLAADFAESEEVVEEPARALTKADVQRRQIEEALRRNNGRRKETAAELFMSERTLYRKIKELGIEEF